MKADKQLYGTGISPGICVAKALRVEPHNIDFTHYTQGDISVEKQAFLKAHEKALCHTEFLEEKTREELGEQEA